MRMCLISSIDATGHSPMDPAPTSCRSLGLEQSLAVDTVGKQQLVLLIDRPVRVTPISNAQPSFELRHVPLGGESEMVPLLIQARVTVVVGPNSGVLAR